MGPTVVVAHGGCVHVFSPPSAARSFPFDPASMARGAAPGPGTRAGLPPGLLETLELVDPSTPLVVGGRELFEAISSQLERPVRRADAAAWHAALRVLPPPDVVAERRYLLARARADVEAAFRSPEEVLVSLAREEERLERAVGREARAAEAFVAVPGTPLAEYARAWSEARERLAEHHRQLVRRLEVEARRGAPNLSAVVGPRTAARLVAAAGGLAPLARTSAPRLQLLGSRRRPSPDRGPRYGAIYRAEGMEDLPLSRRGAYARSVAALAAIAVRADVLTRGDVAALLVRRRDARREQLQRRRR